MKSSLPLLASAIVAVLSSISTVQASCECGYYDPTTKALWTDATIVYFNETGMEQVVLPITPPSLYGQGTAGNTGTGQEAFAVLGNHINNWDDDFGATFRSAVSYNNTYTDSQTKELGLAMQISMPNLKDHVVNGSEIVTRRRDIHYGSFRAMIQHANLTGWGGAFKFGVSFNESETMDMGIFLADEAQNSTVRRSFSATGVNANPQATNLTYMLNGSNQPSVNLTWLNTQGPLEHRLDWLSHDLIQFRTNSANETTRFLSYKRGVNATNLPSVAAPVSFQTFANGEPSASQGPPYTEALVTRILYTRFFYNSTLVERQESFLQQCQSTAAPICNTEDQTLRDSTPFEVESLLRVVPVKQPYKAPIWAILPTALFGALFIAIVIHGMIINAGKSKDSIGLSGLRKGEQVDDASIKATPKSRLRPLGLVQANEDSARYLANVANMQEGNPDIPELYHDWVDSDSEYDSDDFDDAEIIEGEIEATNRQSRMRRLSTMLTRRRSSVKPTTTGARPAGRLSIFRKSFLVKAKDEVGESAIELVPPMPTLSRFDSYRFGGPGVSEQHSPRDEAGPSSPTEARMSSYTPAARWQASSHPTIVHWKTRNDKSFVGTLAQPVTHDRRSHRLSIAPVQASFFHMILERTHRSIFIGSDGLRTSTGERRIDYLDGIRGFACLGVSVGHFLLMFYHSVSDMNPLGMHYPRMEFWLRCTIAPLYANAGLLLGIFFFLPARTMCQRYLLKGGLFSMADSTIRRLPRLILPVLGACLANYMMIDIDGYKWVRRLSSRTWSSWAYYQNYTNCLHFLNSFITLWWATPPDSPELLTTYATGVLWTIPVIVQGLWTCMLCALVAHEIKRPWKRFTFYAICVFISWYVNTWDMFFMGGLIVADLDSNINYREWSVKGVPLPIFAGLRVKGSVLAWLFFLACAVEEWLMFIPNNPLNNLAMIEYGYHPNLTTGLLHMQNPAELVYQYQSPRVWSWLWVMSIFLLVDLSSWFQVIWRLRIWAWFGRHSMAFYLCHGIIFWSWGAWCEIALLDANVPYWAATLVTFVTSYFFLSIFAICFTSTFEYWALLFSKAVLRAATGGYGRKV